MKWVFRDYNPQNARILIDYKLENKKGFVKFSYPFKKSYFNSIFVSLFLPLTFFMFAWYMIIFLILDLTARYTDIIFVEIFKSFFDSNNYLITFSIIGFSIISTFLISIDRNIMSLTVPKLNYYIHRSLSLSLREMEFKKGDLVDNKFIIPYFKNIFMKYECSGDLSRYLEKVEILEYPFCFLKRNIFTLFRKKRVKNETVFRGIFYFNENVENTKGGILNVKFI